MDKTLHKQHISRVQPMRRHLHPFITNQIDRYRIRLKAPGSPTRKFTLRRECFLPHPNSPKNILKCGMNRA